MSGAASGQIDIVMYHYVRDLKRSRYPEIKGRDLESFHGQLDYIQQNYHVLNHSELLGWLDGSWQDPPRKAALLTFDDGYMDHYLNVFPALHVRGLTGFFFPPGGSVVEGKVLDVNKVHFMLASEPEPGPIIEAMRAWVGTHQEAFGLKPWETYQQAFAKASRFDTAEVILIKRLLQVGLPEAARRLLTAELFTRFVTADEAAFSAELYMGLDQMRLMHRCGMVFGCHGYAHDWMNQLALKSLKQDLDLGLDFLAQIGISQQSWIMCYPYGAWSETLLGLLRARGCVAGFTTEVASADPSCHDALLLPRLDTNDLPLSVS
ncbi:MAG: polysaccharide deacetylase family protein [Magnetococcales bacterium]|nr:polysaccharide deacetylase family protein [Magnetococcales bacterium]